MSEAPELQAALWSELVRCRIPARPVVVPTPWRIGPVSAYLFPDDPVVLVDAGLDGPQARAAFEGAFADAGRRIEDLRTIVVTHGHSDHYGCARWLQERSGCDVLIHPADVVAGPWAEAARSFLGPLGYTEAMLDGLFTGEGGWPAFPERITPIEDGAVVDAGGTTLLLEHRPGHSLGHCWVTERASGAVFVGDYLLLSSPTNAGMEPDAGQPNGRAPLLQRYNAALAELAGRDAPALFPGHGPPVTGHRTLIERRLHKSAVRTQHVLHVLQREGLATPVDLARRMFGDRIARDPWEYLADVVGRLDLLEAEGHARSWKGEDGVWRFEPLQTTEGGHHG